MSENLKYQATRGVLWSFVERFSVQGTSFLITIVMARILSPSDYGLIGMLAIFMSLSQVFIDGGFSSALIQKKDRTDVDFSTVFYINVLISSILYVCLFICSPFIAYFYNQPILNNITRVYSLNLIINSLCAVNNTKLIIDIDFKTQSKISLTSSIISGIIGIISAILGYGVWAIVIQQLSAALIRVCVSFVYVRWFPKLQFSKESFTSLFGFGSKLLLASIISSIYTNLYNLVIGKKFSSAKLGYFTRANQFETLVSQNVASILTRVSYPLLAKLQNDNETLLNVYRKYIRLSAFFMFPLVMLLCAIAKPLVLVLLTEKWSECIILIQILSFAYIFDGITVININLLSVKGRSDLVLRLEIIKKTIAFTILFLSLYFDLIGICIGLVLYNCIAIVLNCHYTGKLLHYGFIQQFRDVFLYFFYACLMAGVGLIFSSVISNSYIALAIDIIICPLLYLTCTKFSKLYAYFEFIKLFYQIVMKFKLNINKLSNG